MKIIQKNRQYSQQFFQKSSKNQSKNQLFDKTKEKFKPRSQNNIKFKSKHKSPLSTTKADLYKKKINNLLNCKQNKFYSKFKPDSWIQQYNPLRSSKKFNQYWYLYQKLNKRLKQKQKDQFQNIPEFPKIKTTLETKKYFQILNSLHSKNSAINCVKLIFKKKHSPYQILKKKKAIRKYKKKQALRSSFFEYSSIHLPVHLQRNRILKMGVFLKKIEINKIVYPFSLNFKLIKEALQKY